MMRNKKKFTFLLVFMFLFTMLIGCKGEETSPTQPVSKDNYSILFVGNSFVYTGDVPEQLKVLAEMYGIKIDYYSICPGGATLSETMDDAIKNMQNNKYDYIILQDYGTRPMDEEEAFYADINALCDETKRNGAVPVLYNPAFANDNGEPLKEYQDIATAIYEKAAESNEAILVNAGDAWVYAYKKIQDISLYIDGDYHANEAGAYLTACVFASTLFSLHIKDVAENNLYHGDDAISLGQAAWEFVSYYKENEKSPSEIISVSPGDNERNDSSVD